MAANGHLSRSELAPIVGGGYLRKDAAAAWNAMAVEAKAKYGVNIHTNGPNSSYRTYQQQVYMKSIYGSNAATPGYSNHGWGLAVDVPPFVRRIIDEIGAKYGFAKRWSDAQWESWHIKYRPGIWRGKVFVRPKDTRFLTTKEKKVVGAFYHRSRLSADKSKLPESQKKKHRRLARYYKGWLRGRKALLWTVAHIRGRGGWKKNNRGARHLIIHRVLNGWSLAKVRKDGANSKVKT